jgi:hypothetical protein
MTPKSFDYSTAKEMIGHERTIKLESKARTDADSQTFDPPLAGTSSYWSKCQDEFEYIVYKTVYEMRIEKAQRTNQELDVDPVLLEIVVKIIAEQQKAIDQFKSGKDKALNAVVGQIIGQCKKNNISADASTITALLKEQIKESE